MNFKNTLLASASALVLLGAASGGALAQDQIQQNVGSIPTMPPTPTFNINQLVTGGSASDSGSLRENTIDGHYSDNFSGISHDQQNNGNNNALGVATNAVLNAANSSNADNGPGDVTQDLGVLGITQSASYTDSPAANTEAVRNNVIDASYDSVRGIVDVQQNNGDGNVMAVGDVVSANLGPIPFGQNGEQHDDATQQVLVDGRVLDIHAVDTNSTVGGERSNSITDAFQGFLGMASVQQNNGNGNVIQAGNAVVADVNATNDATTNGRVSSLNVKADALVTLSDAHHTSVGQTDRSNVVNETSFNGAQGIVNVQQNNGDNNVMNVANAVVAEIFASGVETTNSENATLYVRSEADVTSNSATSTSPANTPPPNVRDNLIFDAFVGVDGLVNAQQNNGDNNAVNASNGVVANGLTPDDLDNATTVSATTYGNVSGNVAADVGQDRENTIDQDAFSGSNGIIAVQQNNGDNNAMNSAVAVAANVFTTPPSVDGNDATAGASASAFVSGNSASTNLNVDRVNTIEDGAFDGSNGIATVQQNNGDNNVINAAKSVAVALGGNDLVGFNGAVMADTAITAVVSGNTGTIAQTSVTPGFENTLTGSFNDFNGIKTVQQNNGSNNAIQSSIAVVANVITP